MFNDVVRKGNLNRNNKPLQALNAIEHPAGRALISDWCRNSFIDPLVVYERIFLVLLWRKILNELKNSHRQPL